MNNLPLFAIFATHLLAASQGQATAAQSKPESGYLEIGGGKLWYEVCGSGSPVVLLHDGLINSAAWNHVWQPLCSKYRVLRYDRRGYGRSDPTKERFAPEEDLRQMMRHVEMDRAILVACSAGSGLALDFTLMHPEMVEGLFLFGPTVHGMSSSDFFQTRGARNNAPLKKGDLKAAAENWSKDPYIIAGPREAARKELYDMLAQSQDLKTSGAMEIPLSPLAVSRLSHIQAPTLVIVGSGDIADVQADAGAIEAALPVVSREVWADTGHLIHLEQPDRLVDPFYRFVSTVERREVAVSAGQLAEIAGRYKIGDEVIVIFQEGARLMIRVPGNTDWRMFAASDSRFFLRSQPVDLEFQTDARGKVSQMVIHTGDGHQLPCPRL